MRPKKLKLLMLAVLAALVCALGCDMAPQAMPKEFSKAVSTLATSIGDQAIWDQIQGDIRGHVLEPGLEVYAGMLYVAGTKIRGFDGDVGMSADGHGVGQLSPEARTAIIALNSKDTTVRDAAVEFLKQLGAAWAAKQEPATQPASP